jgi:ankyrin repeat protein
MNVPLLGKRKKYNKIPKEDTGRGREIDVTGLSVPPYPGWHPIHVAAFYGDHKNVDNLVKNGAYVDAVDMWGKTPLHYARARRYGNGCDKAANILIRQGATDSAPFDYKGRTPLDVYLQYN